MIIWILGDGGNEVISEKYVTIRLSKLTAKFKTKEFTKKKKKTNLKKHNQRQPLKYTHLTSDRQIKNLAGLNLLTGAKLSLSIGQVCYSTT